MSYQTIIVAKEEGVATLTFNRPDKMNAIDARLAQESSQALDEMARDDEVKALIVTGAGRAFCSGADLTAEVRATDPKQPGIGRHTRLEPFIAIGEAVKKLWNFHKPAIAAVNGVAVGAGLSLACACDIRISSENARFSSIFVKRGLVADCGATFTLPRIVGMAKALELMWSGDIIGAAQAEKIGLVSQVVPPEQLLVTARELALKFAKGPSVPIELVKRMVRHGLEANNFSAQIAYEAWSQEMCYKTEDYEEGVKSFREKRDPIFKGR